MEIFTVFVVFKSRFLGFKIDWIVWKYGVVSLYGVCVGLALK